jgi:protein-tyrosine phosphatase
MIDIHCHILPGLDDGSSDIKTSIDMLKIAFDDGITHTTATPHFTYSGKPTIKDIHKCLELLKEKSDGENIEVKLLSGADIRLSYELIDGIARKMIPTINGSRYFLLELPDLIPPNLDKFLSTVKSNGFVPIITHPERNYSIFSSPEKTDVLRNSGALFQLTAMSITGEIGSQLKKFSHMLLKKGIVDFIASDAHDTVQRPPILSKAYREIAR